MRTHYDNLHISEKASPEVVKAAYRALAQKWHPDKNAHQREKAERYFKIITRAFEVLSDPDERSEYDAWLSGQRNAEQVSPEIDSVSEPMRGYGAPAMAEAWEDGRRSREQGFTEKDCPYNGSLAGMWLDGFKTGQVYEAAVVAGVYPWRRFFARFIDIPLVLLLAIAAAPLFALGVELLTAKDIWPGIQRSGVMLLLFAVASLVLYETTFISVLAMTPGKWILGVIVVDSSGEKLEFDKALLRVIYANLVGQGLHIPLLAAIANITWFFYLRKTGSTYWDEKVGSVVRCKPMSTARMLLSVFAVVIAMVLYSLIIDALGRRFQ